MAACCGHGAAIAALLESGADPDAVDKNDRTAIYWCAEQGFAEAMEVKFLI